MQRKEYYSVVLQALTGDRLNKLLQQKLLVPTIGQTPKTLDPTFPITQVSSIFHLTPCFLNVRLSQTAQLQSCSWHHRLRRHRGHHTTMFTGWVTLVMMSKLSFMCKICGTPTTRHTIQTTLQLFFRHFQDPWAPCVNVKAHGKCPCARICLHFLLRGIKPGQLAVHFSRVYHVLEKKVCHV